ncbi:hypothetical protein JCM10296v2_000119 [Rhodotorula toruloides]
MPHIDQLPDELLIAVFTALRDSLRFYDNGEERIDLERTVAEFLGPCRLVCRRWDSIALPALVATAISSDPRGLLDLIDRHGLEDTVKELVIVLPGELQGKMDAKVATERRLMEEWTRVLRALGPALRALSIRRSCPTSSYYSPSTRLSLALDDARLLLDLPPFSSLTTLSVLPGPLDQSRPASFYRFLPFSHLFPAVENLRVFFAWDDEPFFTMPRWRPLKDLLIQVELPKQITIPEWIDAKVFTNLLSTVFLEPSRDTLESLAICGTTERRSILEHELLQLNCPAVTIVDVPTIAVSDVGRFLTGLPSVESLAFSYFSYQDDMTNVITSSFLPTFQLPPRLRQLAITVRADRLVHLASALVPRLATGLQLLAVEVERQPYEPERHSLEQAISDFEKACSSLGILFAHDLELASDCNNAPSTRSIEQDMDEVEKDCEWEEKRSAGDEETPELADRGSPTSSDSGWETDDSLDYDADDDERFAAFWSEEKRNEVFGYHDWDGAEAQKPANDVSGCGTTEGVP